MWRHNCVACHSFLGSIQNPSICIAFDNLLKIHKNYNLSVVCPFGMGFADSLWQKGYGMNTAAHKKQILFSKALLQVCPTHSQ